MPLLVKPGVGTRPEEAMSPAELAAVVSRLMAHNVRLIGGCCGTDEHHVAAVADRVRIHRVSFRYKTRRHEVMTQSQSKATAAAPRSALARRVPVRSLHRPVLPLFLAAHRQPDHLERLRRDPVVPGPRSNLDLCREEAVVFARDDEMHLLDGEQPVPHLSESPESLPRIHH